ARAGHPQHVVARRRARLAHERRRAQRHLVLGRAPAREDRDPHGTAVAVGVGSAGGGGSGSTNRPTTSVMRVPGGRCPPPAGFWSSTTPSSSELVVACSGPR